MRPSNNDLQQAVSTSGWVQQETPFAAAETQRPAVHDRGSESSGAAAGSNRAQSNLQPKISPIPVIGLFSEESDAMPRFSGRRIRTKPTPRGTLTTRSVTAMSPRSNLQESRVVEPSEADSDGMLSEGVSHPKWAFAVLLLIVTLINSTFSLMSPIFPTEAERRGLHPGMTGLIFSIYSFINFLASPILGRLMQRRYIKRRTMLVMGLVASGMASAGFGLSVFVPLSSPGMFAGVALLLRMLNGVGAAATDTSSMAILTQLFKDSEFFGTALGVLESSLAVGWMVGPLLGGYAAVLGGFSAPFYSAAVVALLLVPLPFLMPDSQRGMQPMHAGNVDVTPWQLLSRLEITLLMAVTVVAAAAITFLDATLAPFLKDYAEFGPSEIGWCFALISAAYALSTVVAGWLTDKSGPFGVIVVGLFVSVVPFALLGPAPPLQPLLERLGWRGPWLIWASLAILGSGSAFSLMPVVPAILTAANKNGLGAGSVEDLVSGLVGGAYYLGGGAGPVVGGVASGLIGFAWASTAYGMGLLVVSVALTLVLLLSNRRSLPGAGAALQDPLLSESV